MLMLSLCTCIFFKMIDAFQNVYTHTIDTSDAVVR